MSIFGRKVIALVPARGGSKGIPRKNLKEICGRPMVEYTLRAALEADCVDSVVLSSDDSDILAVGESLGVISLRRPSEHATDTASANDVVRHFIDECCHGGDDPYIVYLQPTSPLRSSRHIDEALAEMEKRGIHMLVSVVEVVKSPYKMFSVDGNGVLKSLFDERLSNARRQDLPRTYIPNGAIYVFRKSDFVGRGGFPSNGSMPYVMSESDSVDIDSEEDVRVVEHYLTSQSHS
jgi:CMP-N-acetylneuraminic acid synthetase